MFLLYDSGNGPIIRYTLGQQVSEVRFYKSDVAKEWGAFLEDCYIKGEFVYAQISCDEDIEICDGATSNGFQCYKESALEKFTNPLVFVVIPSLQKRVKVNNLFSHYEKQFIKKLRSLRDETGSSVDQSPKKHHANPNPGHFDFEIDEDYEDNGYYPVDHGESVSPERLEKDINIELDKLCKSYDYMGDSKGTKASVVADTMTADYYKKKGYLDFIEKPVLFGRELLKLFDNDERELKSDCGDALIPVSADITVIITDQAADDIQIIDGQYAYVPIGPKHNPSENDFTRFTQAINILHNTQDTFDKIKSQKILVFKNECKIRRGRNDFDINELYAYAEHGKKSEGIVSFQGVYELERIDDFERLILRKIGKRYNLALADR